MLEPIDHQYKLVGTIAASNGVDGTVLIIPEMDAPTLFDDIALVRLRDARGDLVPARIESVRAQKKNNRLSFFVKFEHINDRNGAETHKGYSVYVARDQVSDDKSRDPLISFEVKAEDGTSFGQVEDITYIPSHPLLVVQKGEQQLLIPFVDEYVTQVDKEHAVIYCKNLNRLMDVL